MCFLVECVLNGISFIIQLMLETLKGNYVYKSVKMITNQQESELGSLVKADWFGREGSKLPWIKLS